MLNPIPSNSKIKPIIGSNINTNITIPNIKIMLFIYLFYKMR